MNIGIKKYNNTYLKDVLFIWEEASKVAHPFLDESFMEDERKNIPNLYLPKANTWVAVNKQKAVGFISLIGNEIGALFILPECQRVGIGGTLVNKARELHEDLEVKVFENNSIGRNFYSKHGFTVIDRSIHQDTENILLRLKLPG